MPKALLGICRNPRCNFSTTGLISEVVGDGSVPLKIASTVEVVSEQMEARHVELNPGCESTLEIT